MKRWFYRVFRIIGILAVFIFVQWGVQRVLHKKGDQATLGFTPAEAICEKNLNVPGSSDSRSFASCFYPSPSSKEWVIFFHGRFNDETLWNDPTYYTGQLQAYFAENRITPPNVVSISFGEVWLLMPKLKNSMSGLLPYVADEVIPFLQTKWKLSGLPIVMGESMGGLNGLILTLHYPERVKKLISLCPVFYDHSPYLDWNQYLSFLKRTGADPYTTASIFLLGRSLFENESEWNQVSPLRLLENAIAAKRDIPPMYLSSALYDKYGNFESVEKLRRMVQPYQPKTEWRPLYGGHCSVDIASVANALASNPRASRELSRR